MSKNLKACFSSNSDDWATPSNIYHHYVESLKYFDVCPLKCTAFDGLAIDWPEFVFVNPPYSHVSLWVDKAITEFTKHQKPCKEIVFLLPVRTDTKWFYKLYPFVSYVLFIHGRLKFSDSKSAPFPSMLVIVSRVVFTDKHIKRFLIVDRDNFLL